MGGGVPAPGKVMVARALRSSSPLRRVIRASHGPAGSRSSRAIVTGSVSPIASVMPRVAGNGPALSPPGPSRSSQGSVHVERPAAGVVHGRDDRRPPSDERLAVSESIVKSAAGGPPGPTET